MSIPVLTFFSNRCGVGTTALVYQLSWMLTEMGKRVLVIDLDPQANLTAAFLDEDTLESLWELQTGPTSIYRAVQTLLAGGDLEEPCLIPLSPRLQLIAGDVALAGLEETLASVWPDSLGDSDLDSSFRILTAFWQVAQLSGREANADIILAEAGPNLGAINRSILIGTDYVVIPLGADLISLRSLRNLGSTLRSWRDQWRERLDHGKDTDFALPTGAMIPLGYIIQQPGVRLSRPVKAYDRWVNRMPKVYHESMHGEVNVAFTTAGDPECLATLKHYRSLVSLAQEARKPLFALTPADGAIGNHALAVQEARRDFRQLAERILQQISKVEQSTARESELPLR